MIAMAFDPQTSGGLMIAVPEPTGSGLVAELHRAGVSEACVSLAESPIHRASQLNLCRGKPELWIFSKSPLQRQQCAGSSIVRSATR